MEITLGNVYSKVVAEDFKTLRYHMSIQAEEAWFSPQYKEGKWDGRKYFITPSGVFLTGLYSVLRQYCKDNHLKLRVEDNRNIPSFEVPKQEDIFIDGLSKRSYQIETIYRALKIQRGILHLATNAGKTECACGIIKYINMKSIFLVHTKELLYQTKDRIEDRLKIKCGTVGDSEFNPKEHTVAMVQTIAKRIDAPTLLMKNWVVKKAELLKENKLLPEMEIQHKVKLKKLRQLKQPVMDYLQTLKVIFVDECHHQQSNMWMTILKHSPAPFRFGLSGTPFRDNKESDWKLMGMTGRVINQVTNQDLIDLGYSAQPYIFIFRYGEREYKKLSYAEGYKLYIINNKRRNLLIKQIAEGIEGITLIIVTQILHGQELQKLLPEAIFVSGQETKEVRKQVMVDMRSNKIKTLIATTIYDEGVDVPNIHNLIIACGGKSDIKTIQRVGRGLRKKKIGENTLRVFDFYDEWDDYLKEHSQSRMRTYKQQNFPLKIIHEGDDVKEKTKVV